MIRSADYERLGCGCEVGLTDAPDGPVMVMVPCRPDCPHVRYAVAEARRQEKDVVNVDAG